MNMYRLENVKIYEDLTDEEVLNKALNKYKLKRDNILKYEFFKKSIDARNKNEIFYNYTIDILYKEKINNPKIKEIKIKSEDDLTKIKVIRKSPKRPIIIGAGPAGLFCALTLVRNGLKPIIIEQGKKVEDRKKDVDLFIEKGILNNNCNVQFGEGGAGTFSDGKLTTGVNNPLCNIVLDDFVIFGAPKQIKYINKPHIGTDNLIKIIANIRKYIIENGGEFIFEEKVTDFEVLNNNIVSVTASKKYDTDTAIFAIGHSARDLFEKMYEKGLNLEKKNFSVGVRIEHKQEMINKSQYGDKTKLKLPPAEYKLAYHGNDGRSCYTFCMCPGGTVMPSSSDKEEIVTNGMSKFARDGENANSAVLVNVTPDDFSGESPLEGVYFQRELENKAFKLGGNNFYAPIQKVGDFLNNRKSENIGNVIPTYKPGYTLTNLQEILPDFVVKTMKEGLIDFDKKIKGFASKDAIMTGVETRSSSPVRIVRDSETLMSNVNGIYPCGEGAGYAGGIMTAAVDGIKCAIKVLEKE